jgi:hypothetical protein
VQHSLVRSQKLPPLGVTATAHGGTDAEARAVHPLQNVTSAVTYSALNTSTGFTLVIRQVDR